MYGLAPPSLRCPRCEPWTLRLGPNVLDELESSPAWGRSRWRQVDRAGGEGQELEAAHVSRDFSKCDTTLTLRILYLVSRATLQKTSGSAARGKPFLS